tara:strand:- start:15113 stop:15493 length:381 start_codon:yes stop_codon:yes gene_type:complete
MATIIKLKSSEVAASVPSTSDLQVGEVALNIADGKFFTKTSGNVVKEVGGAGSVTLQSVTNIGASTTRDITLDGANLIFEGNVANAFETTLSAEEPTTDNTVLLPNASGTLATAGDALAFSIVFGG